MGSSKLLMVSYKDGLKTKLLPNKLHIRRFNRGENCNSFILKPTYLKTRNPIILCHGLYGYDRIAFNSFPYIQINYWQGIAESLRKMGNEVIIAKVPRTGSIAERTRQLHEMLNQLVHGREVNIIGHSMGGLDGRYLISTIKPTNYKVVSLTTISTPHRGSQFMDWCSEKLRLGRVASEGYALPKEITFLDQLIYHLDAPAYHHLTTDYCTRVFNPNNPDDPSVSYFSYNAYVNTMSPSSFLYWPWKIISSRAGKNDGIVALSSSKWGELIDTVQASHFELVARYRWIYAILERFGFKDPRYHHKPKLPLPKSLFLNPSPNLDTIEFYLSMVTRLANRGF